jgi:hypothetical protein
MINDAQRKGSRYEDVTDVHLCIFAKAPQHIRLHIYVTNLLVELRVDEMEQYFIHAPLKFP